MTPRYIQYLIIICLIVLNAIMIVLDDHILETHLYVVLFFLVFIFNIGFDKDVNQYVKIAVVTFYSFYCINLLIFYFGLYHFDDRGYYASNIALLIVVAILYYFVIKADIKQQNIQTTVPVLK